MRVGLAVFLSGMSRKSVLLRCATPMWGARGCLAASHPTVERLRVGYKSHRDAHAVLYCDERVLVCSCAG